jgi:hypothetical protein
VRDFLNAILGFIGAASLTDDEFATITAIAPVYDKELYLELLDILNDRESVTQTRERLRWFFLARGIQVGELTGSKSTIYVGEVLDD